MSPEQKKVEKFHRTFGLLVENKPCVPDGDTIALRIRLIQEETEELRQALEDQNLVGVADGLADLLYVVYGTAVSCGMDLQLLFDEVHRSNMSKVGGQLDKGGKLIKPPTYSPPMLRDLLASQARTGVSQEAFDPD